MAMPRRNDDLLARALLDADLRYGGQIGALASMRSDRAREYTRRRRVLASNARGITAAIDAARPDVERAWDDALATVGAHRQALGVQADPQAQAFSRRTGEARANALGELLSARVRTEEGRVHGAEEARSEYISDRDRINQQMLGLAGERGQYAAARRAELADARAQRSVTRRGQTLSSRDRRAALAEIQRHNREQEAAARRRAELAGQRAGRIRWASQEQHGRARDQIEHAMTLARSMRLDERGRVDPSTSRAEVIGLLIKGVPASRDSKGNTVPAIPRLPADAVRAAVNLVWDRTLSRGDVARLHRRRLRISTLGYPTRGRGARPNSAAQLAGRGGPGMSSRPPVPGLR